MKTELYLAVYLVLISIISVIITVYDKSASKRKKWRIPENVLMLFAFFGGATAMYGMMQLIRHKTKHKKFMIGLPAFILMHLAGIVYVIYFL